MTNLFTLLHQALYLSIYGLWWADVREFLRLPFLPLTLPGPLLSVLPPAFGEMFNGKGIPLLIFFALAAVSCSSPRGYHFDLRLPQDA